ncbi:MAG: hypothetical protein FH749_03225 [Firmicutes bacterium]|nr:hypothetical protein [Bacillota bacterium]
MLLYTPVDAERVLENLDKERQPFKELTLANGVSLLVEPVEGGLRIERVLSGNCNAYLLNEYQPGQVLKMP